MDHTPTPYPTDASPGDVRHDIRLLSDLDIHLFFEGTHYQLGDRLGAHPLSGGEGVGFAVWAPYAARVAVVGDFNGWDAGRHPLQRRGDSGVWEGVIPGIVPGTRYMYDIASGDWAHRFLKSDPFAQWTEPPPSWASRVCDLTHEWGDALWMGERGGRHRLEAPMAIYEVDLGSWRRVPEEGDRALTYRELTARLVEYVTHMGFTHVELLPVMEQPSESGLAHALSGFFAPTSRYGTPRDFMELIDTLHRAGIGVILDWVPVGFAAGEHGLAQFDGTPLYEVETPAVEDASPPAEYRFDFSRGPVRSFLVSSGRFWFDRYHIDALRVPAAETLLYRHEVVDDVEVDAEPVATRVRDEAAVAFVRQLNTEIYLAHPDVQTIVEEGTAWPLVSRPVELGGLGFGLLWDRGWQRSTLSYLSRDPLYRQHHHDELTFRMLYAFAENFVLALDHGLVGPGGGALVSQVPGDDWQRLAQLRLLYGYQYTLPGKKLLFMGDEFAQWSAWDPTGSLDWHLLDQPAYQGVQRWVRDLNTWYRAEPAVHELDCEAGGFAWVDCHDATHSTLTYLRRGRHSRDVFVVACNFTPVARANHRIGVPFEGRWPEVLNSDAPLYGGGGRGNFGGVRTVPVAAHGYLQSITVTLPPLGLVVFKGTA